MIPSLPPVVLVGSTIDLPRCLHIRVGAEAGFGDLRTQIPA